MITAKFGILDRTTYESPRAAQTAEGMTPERLLLMCSNNTPSHDPLTCITCDISIDTSTRKYKAHLKRHGRPPKYCSMSCYYKRPGTPNRKRTGSVDLTCIHCGADFKAYRSEVNGSRGSERKYCSRKCYKAATDVSEERTCLTCSAVFLVGTKSSSRAKKYCSRKCAEAGGYRFRNRTRVTCEYCGNKFYRTPAFIRGRIFCDNECWAKNRTKEFNQNAVKPCAWCGESLKRRKGEGGANFAKRMTCSKSCAGKYRWRTNPNPVYLYPREFTNRIRHEVRLRDMFSCQECGVMEDGQQHDVHHIDYDKHNNHPANLITLCRSCHSKTSNVGKRRRKQWIDYFQARMRERMKTVA